jgi:Ca2+/Na+ antiporter
MTSYRYPNERLVLWLTLFLVLAVIAVTAVATLCGSVLFVIAMLVFAYFLNRSHHDRLISQAHLVTPQDDPQLSNLVQDCALRLKVRSFRLSFLVIGSLGTAPSRAAPSPRLRDGRLPRDCHTCYNCAY